MSLVACMDFEDAILLECESVDGLELEVKHPRGCVGRLERRRRLREGCLDVAAAGVENGAGRFVGDQLLRTFMQIFVRYGGRLVILPNDLQELGGATVIGPLLVGLDRPVQIVGLSATDSEIVNMAGLAAYNVGG